MARDDTIAGLDGGVAEAMTAMALHTVQSRVVLFGELRAAAPRPRRARPSRAGSGIGWRSSPPTRRG